MPTSAWREQIHQAKWCYLLLFKVDVDKQQIQRHHQRWPARMLGQEQHQECRTDYRRGLPDGIHVAGDRPGMRSIAKDDWGDPTKYGFLLIGRSEGLLQLYFIPVFIYTFIKVKSKWGKKRNGCAMKMDSAIFLLAVNLISNPDVKVSLKRPVQSSTKHLTWTTKISVNPSSILQPIWAK